MVLRWHLHFKHLNLEDRNTGMLGGGGGEDKKLTWSIGEGKSKVREQCCQMCEAFLSYSSHLEPQQQV